MGKRIILTAGICGAILGSLWLGWWVRQTSSQTAARTISLTEESQRIQFLETQGISGCQCTEAEQIRLPAAVDAVFEAYSSLQAEQQLPLAQHLGEPATRYTYTHPDDALRTELLLDAEGVLLGAVQYDPAAPEQLYTVLS